MKEIEKIRKAIANRLNKARQTAGYLSSNDFCQCHHFSLERYKLHESGQEHLVASEAIKYAAALHISVLYLMTGY